MEDEAKLTSTIEMRRRSTSVSDDYSVQKTNDDATESKFSAVKIGYWEDRFLKNFVINPDHVSRRTPEILRGYWARYAAFELMLNKAMEMYPQVQLINLGCGFDTLYFRLRQKNAQFSNYVEVDFSSVTAKKAKIIRKSPDLMEFFPIVDEGHPHSDFHYRDYHLVGADLRQYNELWTKLRDTGLDPRLPTIVLAECVLIYMGQEHSHELISTLAHQFDKIVFINYEQVNMTDKFSAIMQDNLHERGIHLPGFGVCESLETQKNRFLQAGFARVEAWTMQDLYARHFNSEDITRIESLEMLDERELLTQLLEHYCVVIAVKDDGERFYNLLQ